MPNPRPATSSLKRAAETASKNTGESINIDVPTGIDLRNPKRLAQLTLLSLVLEREEADKNDETSYSEALLGAEQDVVILLDTLRAIGVGA